MFFKDQCAKNMSAPIIMNYRAANSLSSVVAKWHSTTAKVVAPTRPQQLVFASESVEYLREMDF